MLNNCVCMQAVRVCTLLARHHHNTSGAVIAYCVNSNDSDHATGDGNGWLL